MIRSVKECREIRFYYPKPNFEKYNKDNHLFWTKYTYMGNDTWNRVYCTDAHIHYCPYCGTITEDCNCIGSILSEYDEFNTEKLDKIVAKFREKFTNYDKYHVEYIYRSDFKFIDIEEK